MLRVAHNVWEDGVAVGLQPGSAAAAHPARWLLAQSRQAQSPATPRGEGAGLILRAVGGREVCHGTLDDAPLNPLNCHLID